MKTYEVRETTYIKNDSAVFTSGIVAIFATYEHALQVAKELETAYKKAVSNGKVMEYEHYFSVCAGEKICQTVEEFFPKGCNDHEDYLESLMD